MAPTDNIRLPFRWQFLPTVNERDGSVEWAWHAFTQGGMLVMRSERSFETLTDCIADAKARGYDPK